ncbi:polysaccharide pyruvyl transferase family protein [Marinobacter salicampi]|uniref:polysaccharide pyruvyl transferase family protein n=1 Tax=Marinobacter salicampi TaxID=435907 RepID=UPI00140CBC80|nr:polysaccharide pyruvyl transferase family protein [Marinobacter salicampi]
MATNSAGKASAKQVGDETTAKGSDRAVPRIALFGAAPDTSNMGVSALNASIIHSIGQVIDPIELVIFDHASLGSSPSELAPDLKKGTVLIRHGARVGRRYYLPENLSTMASVAKLGPLGGYLNRAIRLIDSCDAVLDISGGDSFSDIYGRERFNLTYLPKVIAIARGKPLLLLPQTYGPFKNPALYRLASAVVQKASMAWARDENSFDILKRLLGDSYDAERHLCGVDMAFDLPPLCPTHKLDEPIKRWISDKDPSQPLVGFNVSGLIFNNPANAADRYGFKADYRKALVDFLSSLLVNTEARVLLIPHVMDRPGHYESDIAACQEVAKALSTHAGRVLVSPATLDQAEVKWLISRMDWFCGTRMHSTIAALSSKVPAAAISYSDKTLGVFKSCGQGRHVLDPRTLDTFAVTQGLWRSFEGRAGSALQLHANGPAIAAQVAGQTSRIVDFVRRAAANNQTRRQGLTTMTLQTRQ